MKTEIQVSGPTTHRHGPRSLWWLWRVIRWRKPVFGPGDVVNIRDTGELVVIQAAGDGWIQVTRPGGLS